MRFNLRFMQGPMTPMADQSGAERSAAGDLDTGPMFQTCGAWCFLCSRGQTIVLFNNRICFPERSDGSLKRFGSLGSEWLEGKEWDINRRFVGLQRSMSQSPLFPKDQAFGARRSNMLGTAQKTRCHGRLLPFARSNNKTWWRSQPFP